MAEIPDYDEMFPGYFNADHFNEGSRTFRILTIIKDELPVIGNNGKPTGKTAEKWVLLFRDTPNRMVLNETNASLIKALFGRRTSGWIGKRITLHSEPNCGFGKPGVRVCGSPDIDADVKATPGLMPKPGRVYTLRRTHVDDGPLEKFLAYAAGKGVEREQIDAFLQHHCTALEKLSPDELRTLARDLEDVRAFGAESDG